MSEIKKNIKLTIEYDGTAYAGWQRQKNAISVQEILENALLKITQEEVSLTAAGRTDSGVHAKGQVANFYTMSSMPADRFCYALNSLVSTDIVVYDSMEVPFDFHSRFSAKGKRYRYSIVSNPHGLAIGRNYFWHIPYALDVDAIIRAAKHFEGTHDFYGFMSTGSRVRNSIRSINEMRIIWDEPFMYIDFLGGGFLYNMVRIIVGTLVKTGTGKIDPDEIPRIIASRNRNLAGTTAPAHGLCLEEVYY